MSGIDWFKDSVVYHILIDRFAGFRSAENWEKPVFLGGTIRGIIDKLAYMTDLGITTLWISPFYQTSAYHGYHITDFYTVDPHFGTLDDIKDLIREAHAFGLHIIADFVPNHCSRHHPFFKDAQQAMTSEYKDWFTFTNWPDDYLCFLSVKDIPKLNLENPQTRDHIVNAALYWLSLGLDGFRLDHVIGPSHRFWKHFRGTLKDRFPSAVLIGEAWMMGIAWHELRTLNVRAKHRKWLMGASSESLFKEYIGELDGILDFRAQELVKDYVNDHRITQHMVTQQLQHHYHSFPTSFILPTFLDNHDMNRFLFDCGNDKEKLKAAATIQFSLPHPPIIYYGTEIGMTQRRSLRDIPENGDLQARQPMDWQNQDADLLRFYKTLIHQKRTNT